MSRQISSELAHLSDHQRTFSVDNSVSQTKYNDYLTTIESLRQDQFRIRAAHKATDDDLISAIPIGKQIQKNGTSIPIHGADGGHDSYSTGDMHQLLGDMSDHATSVMYKLTSTTMRLSQAESEIINLNRHSSILSNELVANSVMFDQQSSEIL
jgi:hypothetical protein